MYAAIGYGGVTSLKLIGRLREDIQRILHQHQTERQAEVPVEGQPEVTRPAVPVREHSEQGIVVEGLSNCLVKFSKCCSPVPGDEIVGFITRGYGVSVHRCDCPNAAIERRKPEERGRWIKVSWGTDVKESYQTALDIYAKDRLDLVLDVSAALSSSQTRVASINATTTAGAQLRNLAIIVICIALLAGINVVFNDYIVRVISTIFIFMILAVSYNLINGVTGQLSLEPNGFVAVGAYVTALLILSSDSKVDMFEMAAPSPWILSLHAGFLPALLISGLCAAALAVCLAVPVFRVRGDYLAIVTLGFGFIIKILAINNPQITNGAIGLNDIPQQPHLLFWCGLFALLATGMILQLVWSKYGRMMKAIRDDEDAAIAMGVNTFRIKTCAFATSAFFEGIGGGLLASLLTTISPGLFDFMLTFQLLIIIVLGGLGSTTGALLGTVLVVGSGEWLRFLDQPLQFFGHDLGAYPGLRMVVFSLLLLIIMLFAREGLLGKKEIWQMGRRNSSYGGK